MFLAFLFWYELTLAIYILNSNYIEENDEDADSSRMDDEGLAEGGRGGFPDKERNVPKWIEPASHQGSLPLAAATGQNSLL